MRLSKKTVNLLIILVWIFTMLVPATLSWPQNAVADTTGTISEYSIPTKDSWPVFITAGPDGSLWFNEEGSNNIGKITTTGNITEFAMSGNYSTDITAGPDGALWFTEYYGNKIGRITTDGHITEINVPTSNSNPYFITAGRDGALWFTELGGNKIGRITTDGDITEFDVPTSASKPYSITTGPDGALWFIECNGNKIGKYEISETRTIRTK